MPPVALLVRSSRIHHQQALLGEVADCVADAFASGTGTARAAVRHVIDPERVHVVDDNATDLQFAIGPVDDSEIVREDSRLQAVFGVAGRSDRVVHVVVGRDRHDRGEDLARAGSADRWARRRGASARPASATAAARR